ncbi:MAG TPA: TetR family transcriptional regulator [Acetobacteraceae bacterium]|jgi:TetR/AcrR family transcriptional repressor of nem operon|nr:TetR family transcriptional regulator [Acetobacteraceae bacterium]
MRVSQKTLEEHRGAILAAAGALFRQRGIEGVSIADVTRAAGLTHGAFYGHYASKSALAAASTAEALQRSADTWRRRAQRVRSSGGDAVAALIDSYLTERHRDMPESGCALAALGPELVRAAPELRVALEHGVAALTGVLAEEIALRDPALDPAECDRRALAALAAMSGGLTLARAISDPDRSRDALHAAAAAARAAAGR